MITSQAFLPTKRLDATDALATAIAPGNHAFGPSTTSAPTAMPAAGQKKATPPVLVAKGQAKFEPP